MRIVKAPWVRHVDKETNLSIFSIDIHPDGSRFATGGQGHDCGRVIIWNMKPIRSLNTETDENVPFELCRLDSHLQCVNVVRWSHSGSFLASAGDDQLIMIWTLSGRYGLSESYKTISMLRSHSGDILDLSWSPDDKLLASCSVDNNIVIWNAQRWPEIVSTLKGHTSLVKGVTWDPICKYLASQSDDKTLRIWRVSDWDEEVVIREPFEECGGTTHVLRLSWSPDGQFLVSAQAMNNGGSVAKIIYRQDWSYDKDFVGHRKAIPCVCFNPNIFKVAKKDKDDEKKEAKLTPQSILAIGSRDRSLSIWSTSRQRPLVVIADILDNSILDCSWSKLGYELLACSSDGQVVYLAFDKDELGQVYSDDEKQAYLQQLYGSSIGNKSQMHNNLIEDVEIMSMHQSKTTINGTHKDRDGCTPTKNESSIVTPTKITSASNDSSSKTNSAQRLAKGPTDKQIEIRLNDGRRKIIPLFIPPTNGNAADSASAGNTTDHSQPLAFSSSRESKSTIVIEKHEESNSSFGYQQYLTTKALNGDNSSRGGDDVSMDVHNNHNNQQTLNKQLNGNNEKKVFVVSSESSEDAIVIKRPKAKQTNGEKRKKHQEAASLPAAKPAKISVPDPIDKQTWKEKNVRENNSQPMTSKVVNNSLGSCSTKPIVFPMLKLSKQTHTNIRLFTCSETNKAFTANVEYPLSSLCRLSLYSESEPCWSIVLPSALYAVVANQNILACVCDDRSVNVFNTNTGRRLHTPIILDSWVARIACANRSHLLLITCHAHLWLWDVLQPKVLLKRESLTSLLVHPRTGEQLSIINANVNPSSQPVVTISNGRTYIFDFELSSWTLVNDVHDPLNACTDLKPALSKTFKNRTFQGMPSRSLLNYFNTNTQTAQLALISFIDKQIEAAKAMASPQDYRYWLLTLVQNLVSLHSSGFNMQNVENRLRELCSSLLNKQTLRCSLLSTPKPSNRLSVAGGNETNNKIVGNDRFELLREILSIFASNLSLQRLYTEYKDELEFLQSSSFVSHNNSSWMLKTKNITTLNSSTPVQPATTVASSSSSNPTL